MSALADPTAFPVLADVLDAVSGTRMAATVATLAGARRDPDRAPEPVVI
jgi:hypothetical protein